MFLWAGSLLAFASTGTAAQSVDSDAGSKVYAQVCAACHGSKAEGVPGSYPRLRGRVHSIAKTPAGRKYLVAAVNFGLTGNITVDGMSIYGVMPPHRQLSDSEVASLLNYLDGLDAEQHGLSFTSKFVGDVRANSLSSAEVRTLRAKALSSDASNRAGKRGTTDPDNATEDQASLEQLRRVVARYDGSAKTNYQLNCAGCHGFDGVSATSSVPPLKDRVGDFVHLKRGRQFLVRVPGVSMSLLSDKETADVMNWLLLAFSADQLPVDFRPYTSSEVHALREEPLTIDADRERAAIVASLLANDSTQESRR